MKQGDAICVPRVWSADCDHGHGCALDDCSVSDPLLWGPGLIVEIRKEGWLVCMFDDGETLELFMPHEIELLSVVAGGKA